MFDFYELLGVKRDASKEEILKAYKRNIRFYHPDLNKSDNAENMSKALNNAKDTLSDSLKRSQYDEEIKRIEEMKYAKFTKDKDEQTYTKKTQKTDIDDAIYLTKWQAIHQWLKCSEINLFVKLLGIVIILLDWFIFRILKVFEFVLLFCFPFFTWLSGLFAIFGVIGLIASFLSNTPNTLFSSTILYHIAIIIVFFGPAIFFVWAEENLPKLLIRVNNIEDWIISKVIHL